MALSTDCAQWQFPLSGRVPTPVMRVYRTPALEQGGPSQVPPQMFRLACRLQQSARYAAGNEKASMIVPKSTGICASQKRYPTIEIRITDVCMTIDETVYAHRIDACPDTHML